MQIKVSYQIVVLICENGYSLVNVTVNEGLASSFRKGAKVRALLVIDGYAKRKLVTSLVVWRENERGYSVQSSV